MATLPAAGSALYVKLSGASALTSLIGGSVTPRIYDRQAPAGVAVPLVLFYLASGLMPNQTPRDDIDWVYRVEAVGTTRAEAENVHAQIYTALHEQTVTIPAWSNYWLACERITDLPVENVGGLQRWRRVGDYRLKACEG